MKLERGVDVSTSHSDRSHPDGAGVDRSAVSHSVEVRVAAEATQLSVMRAVIGDLAMRADFDIDSIADLRLAVDEACSSLIRLAAPSAVLVCRFHAVPDGLAVEAEVVSGDATGPRTDSFSWRVLSALTDSVTTSVESTGTPGDGHVVRIDLTKGRTVHG
jgi:serine/threonine-protein kinase RsbW